MGSKRDWLGVYGAVRAYSQQDEMGMYRIGIEIYGKSVEISTVNCPEEVFTNLQFSMDSIAEDIRELSLLLEDVAASRGLPCLLHETKEAVQ